MGRRRYRKQPVTDLLGRCIGFECPDKGIKILECEKVEADRIIIAHHYSHKACPNSFVSLLVWYQGRVCGALQCGYGIRPKIKLGGVNPEMVREFDRMWLSDEMPKFSETITLSLFHLYMREAHPEVKTLISYADTTVGNRGTIYKAANYKLIEKIKADFYQLPSGERIHPVTMWHRHGTRAWDYLQKKYEGIKHIRDGYQLKFVFDL